MNTGYVKHQEKKWLFQLLIAMALVLFATCAHSASKPVLVLGDSLSAEYGIARGTGWVALLQQRLATEKFDAPVVNASVSGETTGGGRGRLPELLARHRPGVVVIELGANDGLRGLPLATMEANLRAMITASKAANARVLLVGMRLPPNYGREHTERFIGLYARLARELKIPLAPFLLRGVAEQPQLFQPDRLHPTAQAQPAMLDNIWPHLKPLLSR